MQNWPIITILSCMLGDGKECWKKKEWNTKKEWCKLKKKDEARLNIGEKKSKQQIKEVNKKGRICRRGTSEERFLDDGPRRKKSSCDGVGGVFWSQA